MRHPNFMRQHVPVYMTICRQAFGKTSLASTHDIDFFLPDTGPLSNASYRKRLNTSGGTKKIKLPKSSVEVKATGFNTALLWRPDAIILL